MSKVKSVGKVLCPRFLHLSMICSSFLNATDNDREIDHFAVSKLAEKVAFSAWALEYIYLFQISEKGKNS